MVWKIFSNNSESEKEKKELKELKEVENFYYDMITRRMSAEAAKETAENMLKKIENEYNSITQAMTVLLPITLMLWWKWDLEMPQILMQNGLRLKTYALGHQKAV